MFFSSVLSNLKLRKLGISVGKVSRAYLVCIIQCVVNHLITLEPGMVPALPRYENRERLNILNREFGDERSRTKGVGVEVQENQTP